MENFIFCAVWLLSNQFRIINNYFFPLFSYPLTRGTCAYQGVTNARFFSGKFEVLYFLVTSVLRFARLPYYRRSTFLLLQWWYWRFRKHLTFWKSNNNLKANIETGGNEKTANFTKAPKYLFCDFLIFELIYSSSSEDFNKFRALIFAVDTGRKLNVHKTFRRRPGRLLNVLCTFNLRPVSTGLGLTT